MCSSSTTHDPGRQAARGLLVAVAVLVGASLPGARLSAAADPAPSPEVTVSEERGTYSVTARFEVPQSPGVVLAVLSDYEQIPRFMPEVRRSVVRERQDEGMVVEQEAVSKFMMFRKTVHLLLEVTHIADTIRFVDRSARSFKRYEGAWRATPRGTGTVVTYELSARPDFDVPEFILKRLLRRDSAEMIANLRREFAARAAH